MKTSQILWVTASVALVSFCLSSCKVSIPQGAQAVKPFDLQRYLGKWYEIARLDFKHEKNLNQVTAEYSLNKDGSIKVQNRGYNYVKNEWKESIGKAKPVDADKNEGRLKVSFFGPFYAGYNVVAIDPEYKYALVFGNNLDYIWILSRTASIPDEIKADYLEKAKRTGYKIENLVWTEHK
ncbi:Lipocalin family protein [Pseudopedobacter saltans DSM 12145]|uniref:Outer membrane lipoprotein Blc n=1 Tax=Pseudopedobacter saltans (strain ATCC 51119 / DSM 12145 / JCM 21818 / CCUG 39354 / LMG 10337 / NBRC 100064 / NCIMB 13643) TaxID=762903 RepID=F0SCE8_PSESL|nr:lipocalin family protein [Pseudopedobacter saltans]ADY52782.1 Lipocalin family protein [Pseudopedobacter saltans DSM 12145]